MPVCGGECESFAPLCAKGDTLVAQTVKNGKKGAVVHCDKICSIKRTKGESYCIC